MKGPNHNVLLQLADVSCHIMPVPLDRIPELYEQHQDVKRRNPVDCLMLVHKRCSSLIRFYPERIKRIVSHF